MYLMVIVGPCQIKTNNHNQREKNQSMWLNVSMSKNLSMTDVLFEPDGDDEEDLYNGEDLANKDMNEGLNNLWQVFWRYYGILF